MKKMVNNIPNAITISRIISCIVGAILFTNSHIIPAIGFYIYGAISDAFDGFLARKLNAVSDFGKKLDPISDKIYALSLMAPSIILGNYFMLIPLALETIISSVNLYSQIQFKSTHTEKIGKLKTILLFPTMILGLITTLEPYFYIVFLPFLYVTLKLQTKSIIVYVKQYDELKKDSNNPENINNKDKQILTENKQITLGKNITQTNNNNSNINKNKKLIRKKEYYDRY